MDQEEAEMGRFKPKSDKGKEPLEPFIDNERMGPREIPEAPSLKALHIPQAPLTKDALKGFLMELKPIGKGIQEMSRTDQHLMGTYLQDVKKAVKEADFSDEISRLFEKIVDHFSELLIHSRPIDQKELLKSIETLESKL